MGIKSRLNQTRRDDESAPRPYADADEDFFERVKAKERNAKALTPAADGTLAVGRFRLTSIGLELPEEITEAEADELGTFLMQLDESRQWWLGDWANSYIPANANQYDASAVYVNLSERFGVEAKTLKNYAYVCRRVSASLRSDALSFSHHYLVAGRDDMQMLLQWASDEGASVKKLREYIKELDAPPTPPPPVTPKTVQPDSIASTNAPAKAFTASAVSAGQHVTMQNGLDAEVLDSAGDGWMTIRYANGEQTAAPTEAIAVVKLPRLAGAVANLNILKHVGRLAEALRDHAEAQGNAEQAAVYAATTDRITELYALTHEDCQHLHHDNGQVALDSKISGFLSASTTILDDAQLYIEDITAKAANHAG